MVPPIGSASASAPDLPDYYSVLRLPGGPQSDFKQILTAYQKEALRLHPDLNPPDDVTREAYALTNEAFYVLSDDQRRRKYDQVRAQWAADHPRIGSGSGAKGQGNGARSKGKAAASDVAAAVAQFLGVNSSALDLFDDVFEPLIDQEMRAIAAEKGGDDPAGTRAAAAAAISCAPAAGRHGGESGKTWGVLGSMSGLVMGFIVANVPGAAVGAVAGYKLGQVRDRTGQAVIEVWRTMSGDQRRTILGRLARKLLL